MAIDFELSPKQSQLKEAARGFTEDVLRPIVRAADADPDPQRAFAAGKAAYSEAYKAGFCFGCLDYVIAAEELCTVDPGFPTAFLVNTLAFTPDPVVGDRGAARAVLPTGDVGSHGGVHPRLHDQRAAGQLERHRQLRRPLPRPAGVGLVAERDGDHYVLNGAKKWPSSAAGWDGQGADTQLVVVRTDPTKGGKEGLSAMMVDRGTPGVSYEVFDKIGHRLGQNVTITFENARVPGRT